MNILEVEDKIKGLPDQMLFQEAQMPSGSVPQFLVISEIQRRAKMRQGAQKPPTQTVGEQVVQQGIASLAPPQQAPMALQGMAQAGPQMNAPMAPQQRTSPAQPMMMARGGVTKMQAGGVSPFGSGFDPNAGMGNIIDMFYAQQMAQAQAQEEAAAKAREMAEQRSTQMQEQARRDAFNQALVGIGTGIARGDMAGGFAAGSRSAQERMREARKQALRASERAEALAMSREEAARQARMGAQSFGAEQRLAAMQGNQAELPSKVREIQWAEQTLADPDATETAKIAANRILQGDRPATQENFEYFVRIANDPERSNFEREAARQKLAGSGFSFEQTADGTIRLTQGPQGLTTGTTTAFQREETALDIASQAIDILEPLVRNAPSSAFGVVGQTGESLAGYAEQVEGLPVLGTLAGWAAGPLSNEERTRLLTTAQQLRGQLAPLISGETGRFSDQDRQRMDESLRILNSAGTKSQAIEAINNLKQILQARRNTLLNRLGQQPPAAAQPGVAAASDMSIDDLEALARARGLDLGAIRKAAGQD